MCSWLHENSNVIRQVMVTCKSHHLLMTLAICPWLQVTSLTTTTTTTWSNVTWRLHEIVTLLGKWWLLLITWLQVTWHHYFCKSRAHGQCHYPIALIIFFLTFVAKVQKFIEGKYKKANMQSGPVQQCTICPQYLGLLPSLFFPVNMI